MKSLYDQQQSASCYQQIKDPHEIDIDDLEDSVHVEDGQDKISQECEIGSYSFLDYGIGPLYYHPSVSYYFPQLLQNSTTEYFVTARDILGSLASSLRNIASDPVDELEIYLCKEFDVNRLSDIGIIITGNLKLEMVMIGHVRAARVRLIVEIQKTYIQQYAGQEKEMRQAYEFAERNRRERERERFAVFSEEPSGSFYSDVLPSISTLSSSTTPIGNKSKKTFVPSLITSRGSVTSFVERCSKILNSSPYSPSFQKVLKAVELITESPIVATIQDKRKKKRKHNKEYASAESNTVDYNHLNSEEIIHLLDFTGKNVPRNLPRNDIKNLQEVAAEYVMLHLGGEKYRIKHIVNKCKEDNSVEEEEEGEGEGEGEGEEHSLKKMEDIEVCILQVEKSDTSHTEDLKNMNVSDDPSQGQNLNKKSDYCKNIIQTVDITPDLPEAIVGSVQPPVNADDIADMTAHHHHHEDLGPVPSNTMSRTSDDSRTSTLKLKYEEKPDISTSFECKLFNPSTATTNTSTQPGNLMHTITNESIRDLVPWCGISGSSSSSSSNDDNKETLDLHSVGKWGEALVYQYLMSRNSSLEVPGLPSPSVEWLNEKEESRAGYDIITRISKNIINQGFGAINRPNTVMETTFIEVKTSRFDNLNTFEISLWEWQFATSNPRVRYHIYRVYNACNSSKVRIVVLEDILELITLKKVKLCLNI